MIDYDVVLRVGIRSTLCRRFLRTPCSVIDCKMSGLGRAFPPSERKRTPSGPGRRTLTLASAEFRRPHFTLRSSSSVLSTPSAIPRGERVNAGDLAARSFAYRFVISFARNAIPETSRSETIASRPLRLRVRYCGSTYTNTVGSVWPLVSCTTT